MSAMVETMAWTGQTPWHGLGFKVGNNLTPTAMMKAAKVDWTVSKQPMQYTNHKGVWVPDKQEFKLIRDSDGQPLSTVGVKYKPIQNKDAIEFFTKFVKAGHMSMETAGSLWDGRFIWALARIGKDFQVGKGDQVQTFLLIASPHVRGKALLMQFTAIRVVCWNTFCAAVGANMAGKGNGKIFRCPHTIEFNENVKAQAEIALGLAREQAEMMKDAAIHLSKKKAKPADVEGYFAEVLRFDPKKANKKKDETPREPNMLPQFRQALLTAPGQQLGTAAGTWWGALNAVTAVVDHQTTARGDNKSTHLKNVWMGHLAGVKTRAFDLALQKAA